jgi:meiotically up-regulated gene 157 (Mug157) protein
MNMGSHLISDNQITTDDLAFSAYLKMKGHHLIKLDQKKSKTIFTFDVDGNGDQLKVEFLNSPFLQFYNELRNLKKMF